jgi:hypothetical protein
MAHPHIDVGGEMAHQHQMASNQLFLFERYSYATKGGYARISHREEAKPLKEDVTEGTLDYITRFNTQSQQRLALYR